MFSPICFTDFFHEFFSIWAFVKEFVDSVFEIGETIWWIRYLLWKIFTNPVSIWQDFCFVWKSKSVAGWATSKGKCTVIILTRASQKGTQFHPVLEHCIQGLSEPGGKGANQILAGIYHIVKSRSTSQLGSCLGLKTPPVSNTPC